MDLKSLMPFGRRDVAGGEDPFTAVRREMDRLFDEMSRGFGLPRSVWGGEGGGASLRLDVKETDKAIEVHAELPGVDEKDVQLELADNVLTIKGEKRSEHGAGDGQRWHESRHGSFERAFRLGEPLDAERISAELKNGVLTVTMPKAEEAKPRRIEVKPATAAIASAPQASGGAGVASAGSTSSESA